MKKFFLYLLSFVYLTIASGVAVNIHYCMGRVSGVEYSYHVSDKCDKCGMENKKGCCHNDFKIVKLADDQQLAKAQVAIEQIPAVLNSFFVDLSQPIQGKENFSAIPYHSPPDSHISIVYLSNCVFRI